MALIKGPWDIKWGDNTLADVEEIELEYERDSEDYNTLDHRIYELDGAIKVTATVTLLSTDVAALSLILPQFHVLNGGVLSTGETVDEANGAIDIYAASCSSSTVYNNLDIISCGNPGQVTRVVNARTVVDSIELDDKVQKVMIKFIGEPEQTEAGLQMFEENSISVVS